ncbi:MAG: Lrp/AsnC family transcriptional regulator [Granulosicoccus sp.]
MTVSLDQQDHRILALVQFDIRMSSAAIGDKVGLSATAVQRRLQRMRDAGVITAEVAVIDPALVGLPVSVIVEVDIARETGDDLDRFQNLMVTCDEVRQCWYTTGKVDFVLLVDAPDMTAYEAFTRRVLINNDNVLSFTSLVVLDEIKNGPVVSIRSANSTAD